MPTLTVSVEQVASLVRDLPPENKREVLFTLATGGRAAREARIDANARRLQLLASARGLNWDELTEEQRERFVDDLLHEGQ